MPEAPIPTSNGSAAGGSADSDKPAGGAQHVDVQRLADKVYSLLLADLKLSKARGEVATPPFSVRGES